MKFLSILIITYNRANDTLDLLKDIAALNNPELLKDVVVVDNKSTTDYSAVISFIDEHNQVPFQFIKAPENLGVSRGRNYAAKFAKGDILFFIDDDVNLKDKDTIQKVIQSFESAGYSERPIGAVSYKVLYKENNQMQVTAFPHKQFEKYKNRHSFFTSYYAGCAHAKLKTAWTETGPYPENFFYGMEEYDFSYRLLDKGYCIKYDDSVIVLHKESPLGRRTKAEKLMMMWVNKSKVAYRYLPKKYFYSTALLWSIEYLQKTGFNLSYFFKGWKEIFKISSNEKRKILQSSTMQYLEDAEARLWY